MPVAGVTTADSIESVTYANWLAVTAASAAGCDQELYARTTATSACEPAWAFYPCNWLLALPAPPYHQSSAGWAQADDC